MQKRIAPLLAVISLSLPQVYASNFTFTYGNVSQCEDFAITWTGGTAPYELTVIPSYNRPITYSIPSSSYSDGHGSFQVQLPANESQKLVAVMSDASGFGTGGASDVITVGAGNSDCDRQLQAVDFFYDTDMALSQCRYYSFTNYTGAVQPVTITGVIPGGETFILNPPTGNVDFEWNADVASGTTLIFFMTDSKGRSGGSTQLDTVSLSGDSTCLTGAYPSSLSVHPSGTATSSSGSASNTAAGGVSSSPTGAIVGAVVGGIVGVGLVAAAVFIYLRKERQKRRYGQSGPFAYRGTRPKNDEVDLVGGGDDVPPPDVVQPYPFFNPSDPSGTGSMHSPAQQSFPGTHSTLSLIRPMSYAESQGYAGVAMHSRNTSLADPFAGTQPGTRESGAASSHNPSQSTSTSLTSASRRKAAMAGVTPYQPNPPRFIMHTDAEDVIELPPQYSSLRAPTALPPTADPEDRRASGSGSTPSSMSYPPPPVTVPPESAAPNSARPPSSIMEEEHSHTGLPEPIAPYSARSPGTAPLYSSRPT